MPALPATKQEDGYTYEDYLQFPDDVRCEIIGGRIHDMTPAPTTKHQRVVREISRIVTNAMLAKDPGHRCELFPAPIDVIFSAHDTVQPDVVIVCDRKKIREKGIFGAPEVVFEVLSPSTEPKDRREKRELYERSGVREYFLVNPVSEFIEKYNLTATGYGKPALFD